jgi:hypothetical protein
MREAVRLGIMQPLKIGGSAREDHKKPGMLKPQVGRLREKHALTIPLPADGKINKFIFTCAQNDTALHKPVFENLKALKAHFNKDKRVESASLHVARITYIHSGLGDVGNKDYVTQRKARRLYEDKMSYPPETAAYWSDERCQIAPGLVWCGEVNILPTAVHPLNGFESYTGRKSGIFPHTKITMQSIPSMADEATKFNYTTGACTVRNYIQRKAGLKADFHHSYGALIVEVDSKGNWWCRQLSAQDDGTMYDLDLKVQDGVVTKGSFIDSIVWGDVHAAIVDKNVADLCWFRKDNLLDKYKPKRQFLHDVLDFHARSHHEIKNPMKMFERFVEGQDDVGEEVKMVGMFVEQCERDDIDTIVVNSNHDRHLGRWLNDQDARFDYTNVEFWAQMWVSCTEIIRDGKKPNYLRVGLDLAGYSGNAIILEQDESYIICPDDSGGIECGLHGDDGPNGSRGSPTAFARMGRKMVTAHSHQAGINDGVYTVGTNSILRPDYVAGPSSWSHTFCVIYENGKRALLTIWDGRERA